MDFKNKKIMKNAALILIVLTLIGCGSRKRNLENTKIETKKTETVNLDSVAINDKNKTESIKVIEMENLKTDQVSFTGEIDKPELPATVETKTSPEGNKKMIFKNFKMVDLKTNQDQIEKETDSKIDRSESNQSKTKVQKETKSDLSQTENNKKLNVDVKRGFNWWWLILIAAIIYVAFSFWKKTANPLNWI